MYGLNQHLHPNIHTPCQINSRPTAKFARAIIEFLAYAPFSPDGCSIGKQLYYARLVTGKTQREIAKLFGCDESNLRYIELDKRNPGMETRRKIEEYFRMAFDGISGHQSQPFLSLGEH